MGRIITCIRCGRKIWFPDQIDNVKINPDKSGFYECDDCQNERIWKTIKEKENNHD